MKKIHLFSYILLTLILNDPISGKLGSNIICRFSQSNRTTYWTGEFISDIIECTNADRQELKLKRIDFELIGRLGYKYVSGTRNSGMRTGTKTFLEERLNLNSSKVQSGFRLRSGTHQWPFRFYLNDSLPPSVERRKSFDSFIYYYIKIVFVRPEWHKGNIEKTIPLVVKHKSPPVVPTKVAAQETYQKDIRLHVNLQKSFVAVGKNISFDVEIFNPKEVLIKRVSVALVQELTLGPNQEKSRSLLAETLETFNQFKNTHLGKNFQFRIPDAIPPTFLFHFPAKYHEPSIAIGYHLHFEAYLGIFSTDIHLKLPLIITDHPSNS